jgi:hypothetical protein
MGNLLKLFINPTSIPREENAEAYSQQVRYLKHVWNEESYGLERLVRLLLCLMQFLYPILLIRDIFGRWGILGRRFAVECYTLFKFIFPLLALFLGWYRQGWIVFLIVYLLSETIVHILHLIFLDDVHAAAISYRRSLLMLLLHYAEVVFDFAVIYMAFDLLTRPMTAMAAIYFSIVATATVGFGDITAKNTLGMAVVSAQLVVCVLFIILFINYFSSRRHGSEEE